MDARDLFLDLRSLLVGPPRAPVSVVAESEHTRFMKSVLEVPARGRSFRDVPGGWAGWAAALVLGGVLGGVLWGQIYPDSHLWFGTGLRRVVCVGAFALALIAVMARGVMRGGAHAAAGQRYTEERAYWRTRFGDMPAPHTARTVDELLGRAAGFGADPAIAMLQHALEPHLRAVDSVPGALFEAAVDVYAVAAARSVLGGAVLAAELDDAARRLAEASGAAAART